jgi:hypothetical protein
LERCAFAKKFFWTAEGDIILDMLLIQKTSFFLPLFRTPIDSSAPFVADDLWKILFLLKSSGIFWSCSDAASTGLLLSLCDVAVLLILLSFVDSADSIS